MKTFTLVFLLVAALVLPSCSTFNDIRVEKRHYGKGYYFDVREDRTNSGATAAATAPEAKNEAADNAAAKENNAPAGQNSPQPEAVNPSSSAASATPSEKTIDEKSTAPGTEEKTQKAPVNPVKEMFRISREAGETVKAHEDDEAVLVLVLLIILAIILPPLAVLLKDGLGIQFLINLIFWLLGFGFILIIPGGYIYLGIFGLIAIIHALLVVLEVI